MDKKTVTACSYIDCFDSLLTLEELRVECDRLIAQYGKNARLQFDAGYNNIDAEVHYDRLETDAEYKDRLQQEKAASARRAKKEQKEYEKYLELKKKFEDS